MTICGVYGDNLSVFHGCPKSQDIPYNRIRFLDSWRRKQWELVPLSCRPRKRISELKFLPTVAASASSSPSFGGSEYSEQLLETIPEQKTQRIAAIDQNEIDDPKLLADPDSCFCEFNGVQLHHKICDAESLAPNSMQDGSSLQVPINTKVVNFSMILLHGFGASVFSWDRVMKPLAQVLSSKVLAFDRPAFGLTSRVSSIEQSSAGTQDTKPLNPYSMMFSVLATLYFIDFLAAPKAILVGHSAGSLVAVESYFEAPERIAALILVAPAIFAPLTPQNADKEKENQTENNIEEKGSEENQQGNPITRIFGLLSKLTKYIAEAIVHLLKGMGEMVNSLYKKALSAILRSAVGLMVIRMIIDKFGVPAVRNAWYNPNEVSDHILQGYTKPLKVKGWDKALVEYTVAMLTDSTSKSKPPLSKRLSEISCPVLIVTGDSDRLVPAWNSERLARAIPGASLQIIKNCGHLPQEEKAEEFVSVVSKFLQRVFGTAEEPSFQPVT